MVIILVGIDHELRLSPHTLRERIRLALGISAGKIQRVEGTEPMKDAIHVFPAWDQAEPLSEYLALADQGICAYLPSLERPNLDVVGRLRVRVVPGQIEWQGINLRQHH